MKGIHPVFHVQLLEHHNSNGGLGMNLKTTPENSLTTSKELLTCSKTFTGITNKKREDFIDSPGPRQKDYLQNA
ncbi:hypothetical protein C0995_001773 [Termitomyces sp. Mi166|nr:hypothetical protein C0995_001773 [Termitomyces sp. Mi166\